MEPDLLELLAYNEMHEIEKELSRYKTDTFLLKIYKADAEKYKWKLTAYRRSYLSLEQRIERLEDKVENLETSLMYHKLDNH